MRVRRILLATLFAFAGATREVRAQEQARTHGAIYARVVDAAGDPLNGAEIQLPTLDVRFTVPNGGVLLIKDVPSGMYLVQARRLGYAIQSRLVRVGVDTPSVRFMLAPVSQLLDTVSVNATPLRWIADFDEHRKRGLGQFFTKQQIKQSGTLTVSQFLQRARGIRVVRSNDPRQPDQVTSVRCGGGALVIFLDGMEISTTLAGGSVSYARVDDGGTGTTVVPATSATFDINEVPISAVAAVEVYTDIASVPARYRTSHDACGTILLWTN